VKSARKRKLRQLAAPRPALPPRRNARQAAAWIIARAKLLPESADGELASKKMTALEKPCAAAGSANAVTASSHRNAKRSKARQTIFITGTLSGPCGQSRSLFLYHPATQSGQVQNRYCSGASCGIISPAVCRPNGKPRTFSIDCGRKRLTLHCGAQAAPVASEFCEE
jgi:hypothetical protein